jgi:putative nucleotidyltransferase with HDIG domain
MQVLAPHAIRRLDLQSIDARLSNCPPLPSLASINKRLQELLFAEQRFSTQISDVIRRDPSLTSQLIRLVNSVYYGLSTPINSIEEAVFFLGMRQVRRLTMVTPILEDFQRLTNQCSFPWREFWQHCIGTAILAQELLNSFQPATEEAIYVAGLIHDVGKIVMAWCYPEHFAEIHRQALAGTDDLLAIETEVLGVDHAELGARYLEHYHLPQLLVEVVRYHHRPQNAGINKTLAASVQIADLLVRHAKIGTSGNFQAVTREACFSVPGWQVLFSSAEGADQSIIRASLHRSIERLPHVLEGLV